jgi:hypothetical protein
VPAFVAKFTSEIVDVGIVIALLNLSIVVEIDYVVLLKYFYGFTYRGTFGMILAAWVTEFTPLSRVVTSGFGFRIVCLAVTSSSWVAFGWPVFRSVGCGFVCPGRFVWS